LELLPAEYAIQANHGIIVNPDRVTKIDPWPKKKEAIFQVDGRTAYADRDSIWLSRSGARSLVARF
jgi:hypothetical protein